MMNVQVKRHEIIETAIAKKPVGAIPSDYTLIDKPCVVRDESGKALIVLEQLGNLDLLRSMLYAHKGFQKSSRGSGLVNTSRIFGYQPRAAVRMRPYCSSASVHNDSPKLGSMLEAQAEELQRVFAERAPEEFAGMQKTVTEKVRPEWRMNGSVFTSGIVNKSNALAYHKDRGNFPGCWSAMIALRRGITGGLLVVPEVKLVFDLPDQSALFFDGQGLWHGVTPIVKTDPTAQRFTIVYYALSEMWKCKTLQEEIAEARRSRTETELKRARK
jgi:hypothetical protein